MLFHTLLFLSLGITTPENPADSTTYKGGDIDEVIITEFKSNRRNLSPTSISAINSRILKTLEVRSVKELTAVVPNFFMPDYGSKQNSPIYIRGIGTRVKGATTGFYVDGVPHFETSAFDIDMNDVANVEVYRGPQGTLYGRNSIGGLIAVHYRSPLDYQGTRIKVGYGSKNDVVAQFSSYNKLGDNLGIAIAGGYHHNSGFFLNHTTNATADAINGGMGRLSLEWKPAASWTLRLNSMLDYSDQNGYPYGKYDIKKDFVAPVSYNRDCTYRRVVSTSGLNARYEGTHVSFNSQTSFQFVQDKQGMDQDFTPADMYYVTNKNWQNMVSQDFTLKSNDDSRYQWIVGLFGMAQNLRNNVEVEYIAKKFSTPTHNRIPTYALAMYHQSSYNIWRGLSATAGLRFDYEHAQDTYEKQTLSMKTGKSKVLSAFDAKLHFRQLTPKFSLQYLTTEGNLYYASVVRGYKAGGFNQSIRNESERTFNPEYNWNYEMGAKLRFWDDKLTTDLTLFYIDWRDQQVAQLVPGVGNILHNAGHSDSKGLELTIAARPVNNLILQMDYGYTYARFLNYKKTDKLDYSGKMLPFVPRHTLAVNGSYVVKPHTSLIDRIVLTAGVTGVGKLFWQEDNAAAQNFYTLLNAKISITKGRFTWDIYGKNIADAKYNVYCFKSHEYFAQQGKPMSWGTSVIVNI